MTRKMTSPQPSDEATASPTLQSPSPLPLGGDLNIATLNCNGLLTEVQEGSRKVHRMQVILKFFKAMGTHIFAVQEPHLSEDSPEFVHKKEQIQKYASEAGYDMLIQLTSNGMRGGVALFWETKTWSCTSAISLSPRILSANLCSDTGLHISVIAAHFHHKPSLRLGQFEELREQIPTLGLHPNVVLLADHNSVIVPGIDSEIVTVHDELPQAMRAREAEVEFLASIRVEDAWDHAFKPAMHQEEPHVPKGWTWGFHTDRSHKVVKDPELQAQSEEEDTQEEQPGVPHRRRLGKIHMSAGALRALSRIYTRYLGYSDHKAVMVTLSPPHYSSVKARPRVPTSFLKDEHTMHVLHRTLSAITATEERWWEDACQAIKKTAVQYERERNPRGRYEVEALVLESSRQQLSREAMNFLASKGLTPKSHEEGYAMLSAFAEQEATDRAGTKVLGLLRQALHAEPASPYDKQQRKMEISRLVRELQNRRRLTAVRNKQGGLVVDPLKVARTLHEHWAGIMKAGTKSVAECMSYLESLPLPANIRQVAPLLLRELTPELTLTALENLKRGSSPGMDGLPAEIFQAFETIMVPRMYETLSKFIRQGFVPPSWTTGLLAPIPKEKGTIAVTELRPLCLQNVLYKWVTGTLYLMIEDIVRFVTPPEQKAFIRGRFIFDHIWDVRGGWTAMNEGICISIDFSKAYDSVHHNYFAAFFLMIALPLPLIALLMSIFKSPFIFAVGKGMIPEVQLTPESGVRQGDPLSPALFVMVCSVLVKTIQHISAHIKVLFYADDLLLYIPLPPREVCALLPAIFEVIHRYGVVVGLTTNLSKSAFLIKGCWTEDQKKALHSFGIPIKDRVKYLGILIRHVTSDEAYAPLIARALKRATFMKQLPLNLPERVALLQEWVLPLFIFPARAYFPTDEVVSKLNVIYRTALNISSWGLTLPMLQLPPTQGGALLPTPLKFLLWQHATPFVLAQAEPLKVPRLSKTHFQEWAHRFGVSLCPGHLPWLQLGPIPWSTYPFLGTSCKAFSLLRKHAPVPKPSPEVLQRLPAWHSTLFRDTRMNTYYSPALIRKGITLVPQLLVGNEYMERLPPTWYPVYQDVITELCTAPAPPEQKEEEASPMFWLAWNKRHMLRYLMNLVPPPPRQTVETWTHWSKLRMPSRDVTFMQTALWQKLTVGVRLASWHPNGTACPLDGAQETMKHAMLSCKYLPAAFHIARQCIGPVYLDEGSVDDPEVILWEQPSLSVSSPLGLMYWAAVRASWHLRSAHKFHIHAPPQWQHFLRIWVEILTGWMEHPNPSFPHTETQLMIQALESLGQGECLRHPRVQQAADRTPPRLVKPQRKRRKKELHKKELCEYYERIIARYAQAGWEIIYTDGSSEVHTSAGQVGGYGVFFGDSRDTAEFIPVHEKQTNNRGELRAALRALQSRTRGKRTLICSDSLLVVNGALGKAQKWKRHRWVGSNGPVSHVDLWEEVLSQLDVCGHEVHWIQVPSHIGIKGNHKADELADVGRRTSPLLFGHISVNMVGRVEGAGDEEEEFDELSLLGRGAEESEELQDPDTPTTPLGQVSAEPGTPVRGTPPMHRAPDRGTPLLDVEICTPVHVNKRAKPSSPPPPRVRANLQHKEGNGTVDECHAPQRLGPVYHSQSGGTEPANLQDASARVSDDSAGLALLVRGVVPSPNGGHPPRPP